MTGRKSATQTQVLVAWNVCVLLFTPHIHELQKPFERGDLVSAS